ncbi:Telomerase reverse transcriptase [Golovinomyces cichoracearum]|uniref:Telomerase reverse transcriptase n=1 Tax=Golovinomyces cichoracearum TaxID=62708 RepID=A0A420H7V4_9PEZI|nr:Telomerase reverse transcriptase [Golovinomyces cichoracearum]
MTDRRKRKRSGTSTIHDNKSLKKREKGWVIRHAVLAHYYSHVSTLREYINKLQLNSKTDEVESWAAANSGYDKKFVEVASFLDHTWIGTKSCSVVSQEEKWKHWNAFSQQSTDPASFFRNQGAESSQSKIVDFAIWLLFSKLYKPGKKDRHLLSQGYCKHATYNTRNQILKAPSNIAGMMLTYQNIHVTSMKASPWPQILTYLGSGGEKAMLDLILDYGIFVPLDDEHKNFYQLSGFPLSDLEIISKIDAPVNSVVKNSKMCSRTPSLVKILRNRMMYGKGQINAKGGITFGLKRNHVLNRYPILNSIEKDHLNSDRNTTQILMYIFPRNFGLHNVFTYDSTQTNTVQPFHDYTLREEEINSKFSSSKNPKIPKRLRGKVINLVRRLQILHKRCPYKRLLEYYCPTGKKIARELLKSNSENCFPQISTEKSLGNESDVESFLNIRDDLAKPSIMDYATPSAMVSAFCRAVLLRLIPHEFWGSGDSQSHNCRIFHRNVDQFVLRRRRTSSFIANSSKITNIEWLSTHGSTGKLCQSDISKRWEIFNQFIYYLYDSILIPLIQSNFYATESNSHRYCIFYFRHDVWQSVTQTALWSLKSKLFEKLELKKAKRLLESRALGFSQLRVLPKETGVRPIMNLRKRIPNRGFKGTFGRSINSILAPIHSVLTLEKNSNPSRLGATLFSVGDLFKKLKSYKSIVGTKNPLYFAKVDVQAAFDTIPQNAVLELIQQVTTKDKYRISRHAEIKPGEDFNLDPGQKPSKRWKAQAHFPDDSEEFANILKSSSLPEKGGNIFVKNVVDRFFDRSELLRLLAQHVQQNVVKIQNNYYRQKQGISQGSVLSSLLCNFFYADLEATHLSFLHSRESLLLRLTDDFLLITTNLWHAKKFLKVMYKGFPSYGLKVSPPKTLVNFDISINGQRLSNLSDSTNFPYCGCLIDTNSLDVSKDRTRWEKMRPSDSLTVEYSRAPGKIFQRKILKSIKLQLHTMFLDRKHNSFSTVLQNLYGAYLETATKTHAYISCLPSCKRPKTELIIATIKTLVKIGEGLTRKGENSVDESDDTANNQNPKGLEDEIDKRVIQWLALTAFHQVFKKKQTLYHSFITWIETRTSLLERNQNIRLETIRQKING